MRGRNRDAAVRGEFERVRQQVGQALLQLAGVDIQKRRRRRDVDAKSETRLLEATAEQFLRRGDNFAQIDVALVQLILTGLDLGQVEYVVDDREKMAT